MTTYSQATVRIIEGVQRSTKEYNGVQLEVGIFPVECPVRRR
jgi:hypothetical protein